MRASLLTLAIIAAAGLASPVAAASSRHGPAGPVSASGQSLSRCGRMPGGPGPWKCVEAVKQGGSGTQQHKLVEWVWVRG
jgi:hypothetical protein